MNGKEAEQTAKAEKAKKVFLCKKQSNQTDNRKNKTNQRKTTTIRTRK